MRAGTADQQPEAERDAGANSDMREADLHPDPTTSDCTAVPELEFVCVTFMPIFALFKFNNTTSGFCM